MDLVTRTVVGTWKIFKGNEGIVPHTGRVVFTPSSVVIDSNSGSVVLDSPLVGTLDSEGVLSIEIPTTDQAGLSPDGWYWKVTEVINNNKIRSYLLVLPTVASEFDLASIDTETTPPTPGENYVLLSTFDAHTHTEDEVTDLGVYPDATGAPSNKVAETDGSDGWVLIDTPAGGGGGGTAASTVETETAFGQASAVGTDTEYARQDHTHGSPADPVPAHAALDTGAHGVGASTVESAAGAQSKADAAQSAAESTASTALSTHESDTTAVHGIADTANLIVEGDARLTDDRDPNVHDLAGADHNAATLAALNAKVSDATLIDTADSRLSDDRDPTAHDLAGADHNAATLAALNAKVSDGTLDDAGDARTPSAHAASHKDGGADPVNLDADEVDYDNATSGLTAADVQAAIDEVAGDIGTKPQAINPQTGTTYTPVADDLGKLVTLDNAAAITVTLPQDSAVTIPVGGRIDFAAIGAGIPTFVAGTGATVNGTPSLVMRDQWSAVSAVKRAADTWLLVGDLAS